MNFIVLICTLAGAAFIFALSLWGIISAIEYFRRLREESVSGQFESYLRANLNEIQRWCGNEYPEVAFICNEIRECISNGWCYIRMDSVREEMRKKFPRKG